MTFELRRLTAWPLWCLVMATALLSELCKTSWAEGACPMDKKLGLLLSFRTNSSGHPQLNARLEQPAESDTWELDIGLGTTLCEVTGTKRKVFTLTLNGSPSKERIPPGYTLLKGFGYFRRPERALAWEAARDLCAAEGATLAMPSTQLEMDALLKEFPFNVADSENSHHAWLGATDAAQEDVWVTVSGMLLDQATVINLPPNQVHDGKNENCLLFSRPGNSYYDWPCTKKVAFFCKIRI